jgi:hypothetical protein
MASQVSLAITIDIKLSDDEATRRWTLPDARVDGFAAPHDIAWQTDVNRYKPCCQILTPSVFVQLPDGKA